MFTMKPDRSLVTTGVLPIAWANASAVAWQSSEVSRLQTISTSGMTGTGEKKWSPRTRSGRFVRQASSAIGMLEVLDASRACSGITASSPSKTFCLTSTSSVTASTARSAGAISSIEVG